MKSLIIFKADKELVKVPLNKQVLLVGRSPTCDGVMRFKNVKPVQFMIEHVEESNSELLLDEDQSSEKHKKNFEKIKFETGFWTLIDISDSQTSGQDKKRFGEGAGIVLDLTRQSFQGYDFKIIEDSLQETDIRRGALQRSVIEANKKNTIFFGTPDSSVIEIVYIRKDLDLVTNVSHLNRKKTPLRIKLFPQVPQIIFEWQKNITPQSGQAKLKLVQDLKLFEVFNRGERITQNFIDTKEVKLTEQDIVHISTETHDFYLRLISEINIELEKMSWMKDYLVQVTLFVILFAIGLFYFLGHFAKPIVADKPKPRIIQIETVLEPPKEVIKKEEVVKPEVVPDPPKVVEEPPPVIEPPKPPEEIKIEQPMQKNEVVPVVEKKNNVVVKQNQASAVNNKAVEPKPAPKPKDVKSLGLLGKLKASTKTQSGALSVDQVLGQVSANKNEISNEGRVLIHKPLVAVVNNNTVAVVQKDLSEASTNLSDAELGTAQDHSLNTEAGKIERTKKVDLTKLKSKGSDSLLASDDVKVGFGQDKSDSMQAVGGLDREDIRKALKENKRAITNCYETALLTKRQLDGRMTFKWEIAIDGVVSSIQLQKSDLNLPTFEMCVESVIKSIKFPEASNKIKTTVVYPFVFQGKK